MDVEQVPCYSGYSQCQEKPRRLRLKGETERCAGSDQHAAAAFDIHDAEANRQRVSYVPHQACTMLGQAKRSSRCAGV